MKFSLQKLICTLACFVGGVADTSTAAPAFSHTAQKRPLSFEKAVATGTNVRGCPKKRIDRIESAYLTDADGHPSTGGLKQPVFLILSALGDQNPALLGPLASTPNQAQLASVKGRPICITPD